MSDLDFDMLRWMDAEARAAFAAAAHRRRYSAGQTIYLQGDPGEEMFRVEQGSVRLAVTRRDGREIVLLFLQPGDCFGNSSLIDGGPRPQSTEALTDVEVSVLDAAAFTRLRIAHRAFDDALLRLLVAQMRAAATQYAERSLDDLMSRIITRLLLAVQASPTLRLSQSELAKMVGASRQHVNKALKSLEAAKLIGIDYASIQILDIEGLNAFPQGDCHLGDRDPS